MFSYSITTSPQSCVPKINDFAYWFYEKTLYDKLDIRTAFQHRSQISNACKENSSDDKHDRTY